jgi:hypothetical protein
MLDALRRRHGGSVWALWPSAADDRDRCMLSLYIANLIQVQFN